MEQPSGQIRRFCHDGFKDKKGPWQPWRDGYADREDFEAAKCGNYVAPEDETLKGGGVSGGSISI